MLPDGVRALSVLSKEGIRFNVTLVFSGAQALLVAKAGAYFVSPFLGRLDDTGQDGLVICARVMEIFTGPMASQRRCWRRACAARCTWWKPRGMGAHIGTMPAKVFEQLFHHPLTDRGLAGFLKDWGEGTPGVLRRNHGARRRAKSAALNFPKLDVRIWLLAAAGSAAIAGAVFFDGHAAPTILMSPSAAAARASIGSGASPKGESWTSWKCPLRNRRPAAAHRAWREQGRPGEFAQTGLLQLFDFRRQLRNRPGHHQLGAERRLGTAGGGQFASVKYDPVNPSNSIVVADDWSATCTERRREAATKDDAQSPKKIAAAILVMTLGVVLTSTSSRCWLPAILDCGHRQSFRAHWRPVRRTLYRRWVAPRDHLCGDANGGAPFSDQRPVAIER